MSVVVFIVIFVFFLAIVLLLSSKGSNFFATRGAKQMDKNSKQTLSLLVENARRTFESAKTLRQPLQALLQTIEAAATVGVAEKLLDRSALSQLVRFDFGTMVTDITRHQHDLLKHIESLYPNLRLSDTEHLAINTPWR